MFIKVVWSKIKNFLFLFSVFSFIGNRIHFYEFLVIEKYVFVLHRYNIISTCSDSKPRIKTVYTWKSMVSQNSKWKTSSNHNSWYQAKTIDQKLRWRAHKLEIRWLSKKTVTEHVIIIALIWRQVWRHIILGST